MLLLLTCFGISNVQEGLSVIEMTFLLFCWSTAATQVRRCAIAYLSGSKSAFDHRCHSDRYTHSSCNSIEQKKQKRGNRAGNMFNRPSVDVDPALSKYTTLQAVFCIPRKRLAWQCQAPDQLKLRHRKTIPCGLPTRQTLPLLLFGALTSGQSFR